MQNVSQLRYDEENYRYVVDGQELHCGDCFEVLIWNNKSSQAEWVETRIEYSNQWYLVGLHNIEINGLYVRPLQKR